MQKSSVQQGVPVATGVPIAVPVIGPNGHGATPVMIAPQPPTMTRELPASGSGGISPKELEGCWCVPACGGLYCYGLQAYGEDALVGNPVPCLLGLPFCSAWGLGSCGVPVYARDGLNNGSTFVNRSEGMTLRAISRDKISSNLFGQGSRPVSIKLFALPQCCFAWRSCCCSCDFYA